jgi:hypothetical protein
MHKHCTSILIAGAYATLPGASAIVNVNFSNISTRLRNQLIHSLEVYPQSVKGWGKTKKLMLFLREYYGFSASVVEKSYISLVVNDFDKHKDIYEEAYNYCKALITAARMGGGKESSYEYDTRRLTDSYESGRMNYYNSYKNENPFACGVGLELAQRVEKIIREQEADKLSQAIDVVKTGKTLTMYIN